MALRHKGMDIDTKIVKGTMNWGAPCRLGSINQCGHLPCVVEGDGNDSRDGESYG